MTSHAPAATVDGAHAAHDEHIHPVAYYVRIWAILLVLLAVSIAGPLRGYPVVTMLTAFGIAVVKAWLVCSKFMHLNIEKKFVIYFLVGALLLLVIFYFGVAGDVMQHKGANWENVAAEAAVKRGLAEPPTEHGAHVEGAKAHH